MTSKQQTIYERLENYVAETGTLINRHTNSNNKVRILLESAEYKQDVKELIERYRIGSAHDLQDYKYVLPAAELDETMAEVLIMHKAFRYPTITPTIAKVASLSIAALNGLTTGWVISKITSGSMYSPVAASGALLIAGGSYIRMAEPIGRVIAATFSLQDKSLFLKSWNELTPGSKMLLSRLELLEGVAFPRLS
jgi:hypothetical protein